MPVLMLFRRWKENYKKRQEEKLEGKIYMGDKSIAKMIYFYLKKNMNVYMNC